MISVAFIHQSYTVPMRARQSQDLGQRLFNVARYTQAIVAFSAAISYQPDYREAYLFRGRARVGMNDIGPAIDDFSRAIELRPADAEAYIYRGRVHLELKHFNDALRDGNAAIERNQTLAEAYSLKGATLRAQGRLAEAARNFDAAVQLDASIVNLFERGITYQMLGQHQRAVADLGRIIETNPYSPETLYSRARSFSELGDETRARLDRKIADSVQGE